MMLHLLKNTTFSTAIHRVSDIIQKVRKIVETSDTLLVDALCDVNTEKKMTSDRNIRNSSGEKLEFDTEHRN